MAFPAHRAPMQSDPKPPSRSDLHQAALKYLARYASSEAGIRRVLHRKIERWAQAQDEPGADAVATAKADAEAVIVALVRSGVVSDPDFARMRARSLARAGRSIRSIRARLSVKGIAPDLAEAAAAATPEEELAAALVMAKRRRIGPYRTGPVPDPAAHDKELARLARAGFSLETAQQVLRMPVAEADERIREFRR